ncbi:MAG: sugar ABC transporter permease [Clostridiales Family XIII bacterium]|jgi:multiple sugar transport system permease protein|nr:sugar ABC transporter permease [Clostridiales Family XIII bacterium]
MDGTIAATSKTDARGKQKDKSPRLRKRSGFVFILPWFIGFLCFTAGPMLFSLVMSFMNWDYMQNMTFVGFANYVKAFTQDPFFFPSIRRTLHFTAFAVPIQVVLGILIANLFNKKLKGKKVFRALVYLPCVLSGAIYGLVWNNMLNTDFGVFNYFIQALGGEKVEWLADPKITIWALIMTAIWAAGMPMILFLGAMQNIPDHYYEAAEIDGAGGFRQFFSITLPMITPTILFVIILQLISSFTVMAQVLALTGGGPAKATYLYSLLVYENAFKYMKMGYASALSWIMFLIVMGITIVLFLSSRKWVYYEEKGGNI